MTIQKIVDTCEYFEDKIKNLSITGDLIEYQYSNFKESIDAMFFTTSPIYHTLALEIINCILRDYPGSVFKTEAVLLSIVPPQHYSILLIKQGEKTIEIKENCTYDFTGSIYNCISEFMDSEISNG